MTAKRLTKRRNLSLSNIASARSSRYVILILLLVTLMSFMVNISRLQLHAIEKGHVDTENETMLLSNMTLNQEQVIKHEYFMKSNWTQNEGPNKEKIQLQPPSIYHNIYEVPQFLSSGPHNINPDIPGLYKFHNVCLTRHHDDTSMLGLIYFVSPNDINVYNNTHRCVPCPPYIFHGWDELGEFEPKVRHKCGFHNVHVVYATNVSDWLHCVNDEGGGKRGIGELWGHISFLPSSVNQVHVYQEPMIALAHNLNIGHSLFDHLLVYVRHWSIFRRQNNFPFRGVASLTIKKCFDAGTSQWYCELLRATDAFGGAREVSLLPNTAPWKIKAPSTLNCFETLYMVHLALPRINGKKGNMPTKEVFDEFRQVLFDKFNLPRDKGMHSLQQKENTSSGLTSKKVLFYAHEPSGRRVWTNMNKLLDNARNQNKYKDWEFDTVYDFGTISIQEQARLFNSHDVMIMVHGAQMANSIFAVDGTHFIEVGCSIPLFMGDRTYMSLIDGRYSKVVSCEKSRPGAACLECGRSDDNNFVYTNFTMTELNFEILLKRIDQ